MRLYDMQVTLSSADVANRFQAHQQQLAAAVQAQEAVNENARAELKKSQTGRTAQEQNPKEITEDEKRLKQRKNGAHQQGQREKQDTPGGKNTSKPGPGDGHIIDIKA